MRNTNMYSVNFAAAKFFVNSLRLLALGLVAVIGLSMAACQNDTEEKEEAPPNPFLGVWTGAVTGDVLKDYFDDDLTGTITVTSTRLVIETDIDMLSGIEGTYKRNGNNKITIFYEGANVGTATINSAGDEITFNLNLDDEEHSLHFGQVTGTLTRAES